MRKSDKAFKSILLTASVVLLASSTWAVESWRQLTTTAISGVAFFDCNSNGIRDNNEAPFNGMSVMLSGTSTAGSPIASTMITDSLGRYSFVGIEAGMYVVKFSAAISADTLVFTNKSTATNGSDVNANGTTDSLSIDGIADTQGIDAGIIDRAAPVVTFTNPILVPFANGDTMTVDCDNLPSMNASWASAQDNTGTPVSVTFIDSAISINDCSRTGYITLLHCIWRSTDTCGNVGEKAIYVKIKDSKAPVLSGVPSDTTVNTLNGEQVPTNSSVSASDNCATNSISVNFTETEAVNTCGKTITRTWSASDDCGNIARRFQIITVISNPTCVNNSGSPSDTIRLVLTQGVTIDTCLNLSAGNVLSNIQHCSAGQPSATISLTASNCLRVTPSVNFVGLDTFCARVCDVNGQNCRDMKLIFNVRAARLGVCDILSDRGNINLMPRTCGEDACYCIVGTTDIQNLSTNYTITDNGQLYNGGLSGCQFDTIFSYNYFTIPDMGATGTYRLDYWNANGETKQIASFTTIQQLTDSMNIWDPIGNWRIDDTRFLIYGGDMRSQYGQMKITALSNAAFGVLDLNTGLISNGVKLCFTRGLHTVIFQNNTTGCADTLRANVFCAEDNLKPIAIDDNAFTRLNTSVNIPVLANDSINGVLRGTINIVRFQEHGTVNVMNNQLMYTPTAGFCNARDSFDYAICNANGCDTARVIVTVMCESDTMNSGSRLPVAFDDAVMTRLNTPLTISVLANDSLYGVLTGTINITRFQMHGTVNVINSRILYTPDLGFCGSRDTFNYAICNANGCDTAQVIVTVTCENDGSGRPIAIDDRVTTRLDSRVTIPVLANDILNGFLTSAISIIRPSTRGSSVISNNQLIYMPNAMFCGGNDTLDYVICNAIGCDTASVIISVTCNDATGGNAQRKPVANDDRVLTRINTSLIISPLANDTLNGVLVRHLSMIGSALHGQTLIMSNQIIYMPTTGFCGGNDTLNYEICNANGCDTAQIIVEVSCDDGRPKPIATDDVASTRLNTPVTVSVLTNDVLNGNLNLPLSIVRPQTNGMARVVSNQIIYTPSAGYCNGLDTLDYQICNSFGCDTGRLIVSITCDTTTNDGGDSQRAVVAVDDNVSTPKNTSVTFNPTSNDTIRTKLLSLMVTAEPRNGTIAFRGIDTLLYTPNRDFCGRDSIKYTICDTSFVCSDAVIFINVTCSNDTIINNDNNRKPNAFNDVATTQKGRPVTIAVLANDSTYGTLTRPVTVIRTPLNGTTAIQNNQVVYTPNPLFCGGQDTLTYEICNANGCDTAMIYVAVTCDTTVTNGGSTRLVVAVNDNVSTRKNTNLSFNPTDNDTIRTKLLSLMIINSPRNGSVGFRGLDTLVYMPNADFCGRDTLEYTICDTSFNCNNAFVFINVSCDSITTNILSPIAVPDYATTRKNTPIRINILTNDTLNGILDSIRIVRQPSRGMATLGNDNVLTYSTDTCDFTDTVVYRLCNRNGCDTAIVSINVVCDSLMATLPPVAVFDEATTGKNTPIRISILANDTLNGRLDSIKIIRSPLLGIASLESDNVLVYTPDSCGFTDSLIYRICNQNGCDTAIVRINVTCDSLVANLLAPIAVFDTISTPKGQSVTIQVTLNDTLRGADTFRITRSPIHGIALFDTDRHIAYNSDSLYCGNDTLTYEICNNRGCDTALVIIKVTCDTLPPVIPPDAVDDFVKTIVNRRVDFVMLGNDILRGARFAEMVSPPSHGTIIIMPDSMAMYKPDKEFCGQDSFRYRICNAAGCDTAMVRIDVSCGDTLLVFSGFSPNNDGKNDVLVIRGIENHPDNEVIIMNRWGNQVFSKKGYRNESGWDGTWSDRHVPNGTYFYCIRLNDPKNQQFTGYIQLTR
ncbi:MAG: Ig-like domain-containing protein [Saprospiraceae bacterium]|nr:Ig-like domain-containing protein [Saprospiraceae bacterium]